MYSIYNFENKEKGQTLSLDECILKLMTYDSFSYSDDEYKDHRTLGSVYRFKKEQKTQYLPKSQLKYFNNSAI